MAAIILYKGKLTERATGKIIETCWLPRIKSFPKREKMFTFPWHKVTESEETPLIYELFAEGRKEVQGRIAFRVGGGVAFVDLIESAKLNRGPNKMFEGVGIHLFAIAMMQSFNAGYNGYVTLEPKTIKELIAYYESIGAVYSPITGYMTFYPEASLKIVKKYITGGEQYGTKEFMEYI